MCAAIIGAVYETLHHRRNPFFKPPKEEDDEEVEEEAVAGDEFDLVAAFTILAALIALIVATLTVFPATPVPFFDAFRAAFLRSFRSFNSARFLCSIASVEDVLLFSEVFLFSTCFLSFTPATYLMKIKAYPGVESHE